MKKLAGLLAACLFVSSIGLAGIAFADDTSVVVGDKLEFAPGSEPIIGGQPLDAAASRDFRGAGRDGLLV